MIRSQKISFLNEKRLITMCYMLINMLSPCLLMTGAGCVGWSTTQFGSLTTHVGCDLVIVALI